MHGNVFTFMRNTHTNMDLANIFGESFTLSIVNIAEVVMRLMEEAEKFKHCTGPEKKEMVINATKTLIAQMPNTGHDGGPGTLENILQSVVPDIIEVLITSSRGELQLNKNISGCVKKIKWCC